MSQLENQHSLLKAWFMRSRLAMKAHYRTEELLSYRHTAIGAILLVASALSTAFTGCLLLLTDSNNLELAAAIVSAASLAFSSLHVLLRDHDRAASHRAAGTRYSAVRRRMEHVLATKNGGSKFGDEVEHIRKELDVIAVESPPIPGWIWRKFRNLYQMRLPTSHDH